MWRDLRLEALRAEPLAFSEDAEEFAAMDAAAITARQRTLAEGSFFLGAFVEGAPAGMALFVRSGRRKERHKGMICAVYVSRAHRGQGIGRSLLQELLRRASEDPSLEQISLAVASTQEAARNLYRSLGFVTYGLEPRALVIGTESVDQELMVLRIPDCGKRLGLG